MDNGSTPTAIGRLSQRTGTKVETIRYYERVGLLPAPARSAGGYRLYDVEHLKRLTFIRRARALGFSIDEVRTLLKLADERTRPCAEVRVVAEAHLSDIRAKIADLKAMERVLRDTVARCVKGTGSHCPVIEALYREAPSPGSPVAEFRSSTVVRARSGRGSVLHGFQGGKRLSPPRIRALDLARRGRV
jgi:MerR family mercuric resistance operon transcriptional regulator